MTTPTPLTYRDAGVDIDAGNEVVERIKPLVRRTFRPEVMGGLGGFFPPLVMGAPGLPYCSHAATRPRPTGGHPCSTTWSQV